MKSRVKNYDMMSDEIYSVVVLLVFLGGFATCFLSDFCFLSACGKIMKKIPSLNVPRKFPRKSDWIFPEIPDSTQDDPIQWWTTSQKATRIRGSDGFGVEGEETAGGCLQVPKSRGKRTYPS